MLISGLFVLLAARLEPSAIPALGWGVLAVLLGMQLLGRPLAGAGQHPGHRAVLVRAWSAGLDRAAGDWDNVAEARLQGLPTRDDAAMEIKAPSPRALQGDASRVMLKAFEFAARRPPAD